MRQIRIDFSKDVPHKESGDWGHEGEHNKTALECILPPSFNQCIFINAEFRTEDNKKIVFENLTLSKNKLIIPITQQLTIKGRLLFQLVGYVLDEDAHELKIISKTDLITGNIAPSVNGVKTETNKNPSLLDSIMSKVYKLMEHMHSHHNKEILDAITEDSLKSESSPEIPLVYALPENPKTGDACRLIRSEITAADGGRTVIFDYANLENLVKAGETNYNEVNYTISVNADKLEFWLRISVSYHFDSIEITVEKFNSIYSGIEDDFDQWCNIFCLNDNGEWEFSTEDNNVGYNSSYHYNSKTKVITYLSEPLESINIPNEYISSIAVEKDIDTNVFDINIFHLEPIIMIYDGEWRAVANESLLYKQKGATISAHDITEKSDGSKFFRLYLDWGNKTAPTGVKKWIDIPIEEAKDITEPSIGTQSTGIQLQLGGTEDSAMPVAYINDDGDLIFEIGGNITDARINEKGELEVEFV